MTSQIKVDTIVDKAGSGGTNVKIGNTSTYVSDGGATTQNTVKGLAKSWINISMNGNSIRDSHNVGSITDNSQGNFSINFSNNMANANYSTSATGGNYSSGEGNWDHIAHSFNYATNHFRVIGTNNNTDDTVDLPACSVIIFGDIA